MPRRLGTEAEGVEFIVKKGQSLGAIARSLAEQDLITSRYLFVTYAVLIGHERDFKAGMYKITQPVSIVGLVNLFSRGLSKHEDIIVTIPEGSNVADIDRILVQAGLISEGDFLNSGTIELEGYLFPDTYRLRQQSTPKESRGRQPTINNQPKRFNPKNPKRLNFSISNPRRFGK